MEFRISIIGSPYTHILSPKVGGQADAKAETISFVPPEPAPESGDQTGAPEEYEPHEVKSNCKDGSVNSVWP